MQKAYDNPRGLFLDCYVGLKVKREEVEKWFGNVELIDNKLKEH